MLGMFLASPSQTIGGTGTAPQGLHPRTGPIAMVAPAEGEAAEERLVK